VALVVDEDTARSSIALAVSVSVRARWGPGCARPGSIAVNEPASPTARLHWTGPNETRSDGASRVTFDVEPYGEIVRVTVTHDNLADKAQRNASAAGWAAVLSHLKSFLETGHPLPQEP
jgi:hypothetical protein